MPRPTTRGSLHARSADETVEIESYLLAAEHIRAAEQAGADAIHPGYGFLAENADFAAAVDGGRPDLGRPVRGGASPGRGQARGEADRRSRQGCPSCPRASRRRSASRSSSRRRPEAAAAGCGSCASRSELDEALEAAAREAEAAFGDGTVFCERYVERPRHVEIQLLADTHGTVLALGERDCSVQRRHQKVLEESPSPAVDPELRAEMSEAAVAFAKAIGYASAGTAEFMLDGRDFFFLELNGRIQVEHPVTELVTGRDLIRDQIRIAEGERLSATGTQSPQGHAVEVRLYAEDPRSFLPQAGTLERLRLPTGIRVDAGVAEGDEIGIGYDPMIAKLIAHGPTRAEALARLADALAETEVGGVTTNLPFLRWLVAHPVLQAGEATTAFLTEYPPLSEPPLRLPDAAWRGGWRLNLAPVPPAAPPDVDSAAHDHVAGGGESRVTAPMPGTVIQVNVAPGDHVEARRPLLVLEAMKMETPLTAPYDSTVKAVHVDEGDRVAGGALLVELEAD